MPLGTNNTGIAFATSTAESLILFSNQTEPVLCFPPTTEAGGPWPAILGFLSGCYIVFGLLSGLLNGFCLFAMAHGKILQKNGTFLMVGALCVSDFMEGFLSFFPTGINRLFSVFSLACITQRRCFMLNIPLYFSVPLTGFIMLVVAIERLYAIAVPIHYRQHGNPIVKAMVVASVTGSVAFTVWGFLVSSDSKILSICNTSNGSSHLYYLVWSIATRGGPCVLSCLAYLAVVVLYKRQKRTISKLVLAKSKRSQASLKAQSDLLKMVTCICLAYFALTIVGNIFLAFLAPLMQSPTSRAVMIQIGGNLILINSVINALIFPLKNEEIKKAVKVG